MVKVITFKAESTLDLDKKVNMFISEENVEVVDIKFSTEGKTFYAMLMYKESKKLLNE